jgi:hypothetical protein
VNWHDASKNVDQTACGRWRWPHSNDAALSIAMFTRGSGYAAFLSTAIRSARMT